MHVDNLDDIVNVYSIIDHERQISYVSEEPGPRLRGAPPFIRAKIEQTVVYARHNTTELTISEVRVDSAPPRKAQRRRPSPSTPPSGLTE